MANPKTLEQLRADQEHTEKNWNRKHNGFYRYLNVAALPSFFNTTTAQ